MKTPFQILSISLFLLTGCSSGASGIVGNPTDTPVTKEVPKVSEIQALIENAYSGKVFTGTVSYIYPDKHDKEGNFTQANSYQIPGAIMSFLEMHTGALVMGKIPFFNEKGKVVGYEYFVKCSDNSFCASFYEFNIDFEKYTHGSIGFQETVFRIKTSNSPSIRLSKKLRTTRNKYYHGQYAMRLSDGKVASLDPLDTDITNTGALFERMNLIHKLGIKEFTKLIHDRYYLSGGLSVNTGVLSPYKKSYLSGSTLIQEETYFTGVLMRNKDPMKVPTWLGGGWNDQDGTTSQYNDGYEIQLFNSGGGFAGNETYMGGRLESHGDTGEASYVLKALVYGTFSFDNLMSRTTGTVFNSPPFSMPCIELICREDEEFVYP